MKLLRYLFILTVLLASCSTIELSSPTIESKGVTSAKIRSGYSCPENKTIVSKGVYLSKTDEKPGQNQFNFIGADSISGESFYTTLSSLKPGETYYIRSFIRSKKELFYSEALEFTTIYAEKPVLDSAVIRRISYSAVVLQNSILNADKYPPSEIGICYATHYSPDTSNTKIKAIKAGDFYFATIPYLVSGGTYYARFYAINDAGITYSEQIEFTTYDKKKRPYWEPDRKHVKESKQAMCYLGATEMPLSSGFTSCYLNGYAYQMAPGDVLEEYPLSQYHQVSYSPSNIFPSDVLDRSDSSLWKIYERIIEPGEKGMKHGSKVHLYFRNEILSKITINIPSTSTEDEHHQLAGMLSGELARQYGSAQKSGNFKSTDTPGLNYNYSFRQSFYGEIPIRIGFYESYIGTRSNGIIIEFCMDGQIPE